ncbi:MAG: RNA polymerase sigma factor [Roseburia inulinivorans]
MNEQETESKDYSDLYEAIFHLPEQIKLCVTLYYMEGYSVKEVAALLDTTESAVKKQAGKGAGKIKRSAGRLRHSDDPLEQTYKNTDIE